MSFTRHLPTVARLLLGFVFFASGLANLLGFIPPPPPTMAEEAVAFATALMNSGFMMPLIFVTQFVAGLLLLVNRFVPLALALIAPFIVNSVAFHVFLEHTGLPIALVVLALELYLAWSYRAAYRPMLAAKTVPTAR